MVIPAEWVKGARVEATAEMKLHFQLKMRNLAELERVALSVSDPLSPATYGKHWTREQVDELTAPSAESFAVVRRWLEAEASVSSIDVSSSVLVATMPVSTVERMLNTEVFTYTNRRSGDKLARVEHYSVPADIAAEVAFVGGLKHFPRNYRLQQRENPSAVSESVDPSVIAAMYGTKGVSSTAANNSQAVVSFLGQYALSADLDEFFLLFARESLGDKPNFVGYDGWYAGMEASLDIQYIMGVSTHTPTWFWEEPNNNATNYEPFLTWLEDLENRTDIPILWSVSYGEPEWAVPSDYLEMVNGHFAKLAARGITVFFASGDSGADCQPSGLEFAPDFPVSSPWVTAVGGTAINTQQGSSSAEIVNTLSGGGFSNVFGTASYQAATVESYLNGTVKKPNFKYFNQTGRAYPDVAALSNDFTIVIDLLPQPGIGGTSAASPTTAGVFALLNDLRLNAGKAPLGFLNPAIYSVLAPSGGFNDITIGSNSGSSEGTACNGIGFPAVTGWDPATGFGSPNYTNLAQLVMQLP